MLVPYSTKYLMALLNWGLGMGPEVTVTILMTILFALYFAELGTSHYSCLPFIKPIAASVLEGAMLHGFLLLSFNYLLLTSSNLLSLGSHRIEEPFLSLLTLIFL